MEELKKTICETLKDICKYSGYNLMNTEIRKTYCNLLDKLYKDLLDKLKKQYPKLLELRWGIEIVFLICIGFDNYEISSLLGLNKNTIEHKQSVIRKIFEIGMRGDIKSFFMEKRK
jgi:DNA-binding NarL/FixJ family response regulator